MDAVPARQPVVAANCINHWFGSGHLQTQVLHEINFKVYAGEFVILTGPSGSGKSTLLSLVGCLRSLQDGSLKLLGKELKDATKEQRVQMRRNFGYITQSSNLLSFLTAQQNVEVALEIHPELSAQNRYEKSIEMLTAVGLAEHVDANPKHLSGGQRQRVTIASALVHQPKLVLADEPTAALDSVSGRNMVSLMRQLASEQSSAVMMVTHDHRILDIADRIINVEDGRLSQPAAPPARALAS